MRVLISGYAFPSIAVGLASAFIDKGYQVETFLLDNKRHWFDRIFLKRVNQLLKHIFWRNDFAVFTNCRYSQEQWYQRRFENVLLGFDPAVVIVIQGKPVFSILKFKKRNIHFIGWWIEPSDREDEILKISQGFDDYFSYSKKTVEILASRGVRAGYMQHAFNPKVFFPKKSKKIYDLVFVGAWSPWRDAVLKKVLEQTTNIRIFGSRWASRSTIQKSVLMAAYGGEHLSESAVNDLYNQANIVLNASRAQMSSGLNLRFFEVLATGTLLLSDIAPEIDSHFRPGRDLVVFNSLEDLGVKVTHLLANKELRGQIAESGYRIVHTSHGYSSLASRLIDQCSVFH
jgi:glycosyltransferase involved in cell wall biosynthesis